jgi:hypothetical protein
MLLSSAWAGKAVISAKPTAAVEDLRVMSFPSNVTRTGRKLEEVYQIDHLPMRE